MYSDQYIEAVPIFRLSALAMLFHLLNPTLVLRALDRNDVSLKINIGLLLFLPGALFLGMKNFGLNGIIGAHAVILIGGRVITHIALNGMLPVYLPYITPLESILEFYRKVFRKGWSLASDRFRK